jgi:hypothetical protein
VTWDRTTLPPAECPASDLPEPEPTAADLLALDTFSEPDIDHRLHRALLLAAHEHTHRGLMKLRHQLAPATSAWQLEGSQT